MPTALLESGTTGGTAVLDSWTVIALKRTSVTGLFPTPTARCRSPPRPISRDPPGPRVFGLRKEPLSAARKLDGTYMRAVKMVLALCFVLGAAFAFGAV